MIFEKANNKSKDNKKPVMNIKFNKTHCSKIWIKL